MTKKRREANVCIIQALFINPCLSVSSWWESYSIVPVQGAPKPAQVRVSQIKYSQITIDLLFSTALAIFMVLYNWTGCPPSLPTHTVAQLPPPPQPTHKMLWSSSIGIGLTLRAATTSRRDTLYDLVSRKLREKEMLIPDFCHQGSRFPLSHKAGS